MRFRSDDLGDIQLNNIVSLRLEILSVTQGCSLTAGKTLIANNLVLTRVDDVRGDPTYVVPLDRFEEEED